MSDLLSQAIEQVLRLYDLKVGEGDLTTETLWPYARHTEAQIRVDQEVSWFPFPILDAAMKRGDETVVMRPNPDVDAPYSPGDIVAVVEGNGRAIVTGWFVAAPIVSFLSSVYDKVSRISKVLKPNRIDVGPGFDVPIGYDKLIGYAVEAAEGISLGSSLDEIIYLSSDHIRWAGSLEEAMKRTIKEIGDKRSLIKIVVEVSNPEEVFLFMETKADLVYCKHFDIAAIGKAKDLTQGWVRLMVDETISPEVAKDLRAAGVRIYMVDVRDLLKTEQMYTIQFKN